METLRFWYIFCTVPDFEFDPDKSAAILAKHGIDFVTAQALWVDQDAIVLPTDYHAESRDLVVGMIGPRLWTAVVTYRGSAVQIISVRRARDDERAVYERSRS